MNIRWNLNFSNIFFQAVQLTEQQVEIWSCFFKGGTEVAKMNVEPQLGNFRGLKDDLKGW